jgi:hypothetical protein
MTSRTSGPSEPHPERRCFAEASSGIFQNLEEEINANALDDIALQTRKARKLQMCVSTLSLHIDSTLDANDSQFLQGSIYWQRLAFAQSCVISEPFDESVFLISERMLERMHITTEERREELQFARPLSWQLFAADLQERLSKYS